LEKHKTNPVTGERLTANNLITLHFHKNEDGEYCCPATMKGKYESRCAHYSIYG
jgi:peptidyl-prolyl cis-trans isomerase-like protein 2